VYLTGDFKWVFRLPRTYAYATPYERIWWQVCNSCTCQEAEWTMAVTGGVGAWNFCLRITGKKLVY